MRKNRLLSVVLCAVFLFSAVFVPSTFAQTQGRITGDGVRIRAEATTNSDEIGKLDKGSVVTINSTVSGTEAVSGGGTAWYNITSGDKTGYVYGKYVEEIAPAPFDPDFEANLLNFPESYRAPLREIHNVYPNWVFKADPVKLSLDEAINLEHSEANMFAIKKWVELAYGLEWRDPRADANNPQHILESRWTFASRAAVGFFMDPRNALTVSAAKASFPNIFTFMEQSYDSATQTVDGLRTVINGTFLNSDEYINVIMSAASESGVSPYIIASTIITEQGTNGTSALISGVYPGYEGYYNYFNYGASGDNVIVNGLEYAKKAGWDSPAAAIIGGAKKYGSGYVGTGQDTYYYMDFNVNGGGLHQYASSLYDQCVKAYFIKGAYTSKPEGALTFKIPVYSNMPETVYTAPTMENYEPQPVEPTPPPRRKGDFDGDGEVTVVELATIRMYLLGIKPLSAEEKNWLEVSGDNEITVDDLALVRMYLLGLVSI